MFNLLKKYFRAQRKPHYSLKISDIDIKDNTLVCRIEDDASINPYDDISASTIFANDRMLSQMNPRELLKLKEKYDRFVQEYVVVTETHCQNKYKLAYAEQEFLMEGKDICKDLNLLKSMRIEDAFRIIYSTGFDEAMRVCQQMDKLDEQRSKPKEKRDNVLSLKKRE